MKIAFFILTVFFIRFITNAQCTLNNSQISNSKKLTTSSIVALDNLILAEKGKLESFFKVSVDLFVSVGSNGLARNTCSKSNCNGTIELGKDLLMHEYAKIGPVTKKSLGKYMIISIMAHEFAHIFQYSHPELKFKNSVVQEVHADMLAGWYMAQYLINEYGISREDVKYKFDNSEKVEIIDKIMQDIGIGFGWMGDEEYWSAQHHGNYWTRAYAYKESWRCMYGQPVQISCSSFTEWLKGSVWLAEIKVRDDYER